MSTQFKASLAMILAIGLVMFGNLFYKSYNDFTQRAENRGEVDLLENKTATSETTETDNPSPTNSLIAQSSSATNLAVVGSTNTTNINVTRPKQQTNAIPSTNTLAIPQLPDGSGSRGKSGASSNLGFFIAGFFVCLVGLGVLVGQAVSNYFANKAVKTMYNDEGEGMSDPEYEQAEQAWANGSHLEAIGLMRQYLAKNPREQHVALRIAEIYEKDLNNPLASALEYEEVLTKKLSPERWGWAAIHLCNLYYKLGNPQKAYDLLKRIDSEYGQTAAAEKARKRLSLIESEGQNAG